MALMDNNRFLTARELSQVLGVSRSGVFQLARRGALPAGYRLGHSRRWLLGEVKDWLKEQQTSTQKGAMK